MFEERCGIKRETITVVSLIFINLVIHCHRLALRKCVFSTLGASGIPTQDTYMGGATLFDACNRSNNLIRLEILWKLPHRWAAGAQFMFNCFMHWMQLTP